MVECKICDRKFKTYKGLSQHILKHNISSNDYYDKYLKRNKEEICNLNECQNKTSFMNINLGYRKYCCSNHASKCEKNINYKNKIMEQIYKDKEYKKKLSVGCTKFWKSEEGSLLKKKYSKERKNKKRPEISNQIKISLSNSDTKKKHINAINDSEVKKRRSKSMIKAWKKLEVRENYRIGSQSKKSKKGHKKQQEYMLNGGAAHARSFIKSPSKPQIKLFDTIKSIFSTAILEYKILNYNVDIAIPQLKIAIEYDGSYWHKNKKYDNKRQTKIEKLGWQFIRYIDQIPTKNSIITDMNKYLFKEV